jgi:hypothetical protein
MDSIWPIFNAAPRIRHSALASRSAFDSVMKLPYSVPLLPLPLLLLPELLLLPPPKDLAMLSVKEPRIKLAPMLAKPKALPICVEGTLHSKCNQ